MRIQLTLSVGPILFLTLANQLAAVSIRAADPPGGHDLQAAEITKTTAAEPKIADVAAPENKLKAVAATVMMGNELESFTENQDVDEDDEDEDEDEEDFDEYDDEDDEDEDEDEDEDDEEDDDDYDEEEYEDEDLEAEEYDDDEYDDEYEDEDQDGLADEFWNDSICAINSRNPLLQRRDQILGPSIIARRGTDIANDGMMAAEATAEPGGACIDSVVNFSLRFRERCTITCLKIMTHIFVKPDILGLLNCFGCSNFLVSGFYAIGQDCIGLFTSPVKGTIVTPPIPGASPAANGAKSTMEDQTRFVSESTTSQNENPVIHPADAGLPSFDFGSLINNLANVNFSDVQDWLNIGMSVAQLVQPGQTSATEEEMANAATSPASMTPSESFTLKGAEEVEGEGQAKAQQGPIAPMDKDTFNQYILKAASFANWKLTPEMLEASGAYDRAQAAGIV
ncbi:hypothetical protein EMPS_05025 [Entomortierella parvispora]|uniref:Uncharacterized protein n=1 Tax=Entomortierella parvispora TaxID=205924 RepID=A0A9P3LW31_9FUNG|nr:hypothetical protein EMPS_05025 [Entomortierella parvispora]